MEVGFAGLGRVGLDMARRLLRHGHAVVAYDRDPARVRAAAEAGAAGAASLAALVDCLTPPRTVWLMLPAGPPTEETIRALGRLLAAGDVVVDGGATPFREDARRAAELAARGIHYLDCGTSGGVWGLAHGYCLMVGGEAAVFRRVEPLFRSLAAEEGYALVGPHGAGHFVKMVHNGIEYGLMQAYAEGFEVLHRSPFGLDLARVARLWLHGSVIRSWLLELAAAALAEDPGLDKVRGYVEDSGEGRGTVLDAIAHDVPAWAITAGLFARFRSRQEDPFADRLLTALRHAFGGHAAPPRES